MEINTHNKKGKKERKSALMTVIEFIDDDTDDGRTLGPSFMCVVAAAIKWLLYR